MNFNKNESSMKGVLKIKGIGEFVIESIDYDDLGEVNQFNLIKDEEKTFLKVVENIKTMSDFDCVNFRYVDLVIIGVFETTNMAIFSINVCKQFSNNWFYSF